MPLVKAKCTNCGANLNVDAAKDAAVCEHCGAAFIVEKAINNYNTTNNIRADVVNIYGGNSSDFVIRAGKLEKYNGASTDVVIPDTVKEIGEHAFLNCSSLTSIIIPNSVTHIGEGAFVDCSSLTNIVIPDSVIHIDSFAFANCSGLKSIVIPNTVTHIGMKSFSQCNDLQNITISSGVKIEYIPENSSRTYVFDVPSDIKNVDSDTLAKALFGISGWNTNLKINGVSIQPFKVNSGCYIATAVYGSYNSPQVLVLRRFRDETLSKSVFGRLFIKFYYRFSPPVANRLMNTRRLNSAVRRILDKFVKRLSENTDEQN